MAGEKLSLEKSSPAPAYSPRLNEGEERLGIGASSSSTLPAGTFKKKISNISLTLYNQENDAPEPIFSLESTISGTLSQQVYEATNVESISITIEGWMNTDYPLTIKKVRVANDTHDLYKREFPSFTCPAILPFSFPFPITYNFNGLAYPLPPSCQQKSPQISLLANSSFIIQVEYHLVVTIIRAKGSFMARQSESRFPITYRPPSQLARPIPRIPAHFPGQEDPNWIYLKSSVDPSTGIRGVICTFIIPAAREFGMNEAIPFFLRLSGITDAVRALLTAGRVGDESNDSDVISTITGETQAESRIIVRLIRNYHTHYTSFDPPKEIVLGHGTLEPLSSLIESPEEFIWKGEVKSDERLSIGGFADSGPVQVQDCLSVILERRLRLGSLLAWWSALHEVRYNISLFPDSYGESK